jgi:ribosomal protein L18E
MQKVNATVSEMLQQDGTLAEASSTRFPHNIASSLPRASQKRQQITTSRICFHSRFLRIKTASKRWLTHFNEEVPLWDSYITFGH